MPKESIETLVSELVHEEDWRRMRATVACLSGGPRAVHALIQALQTGLPALKAEAAAMLARVNDPQAGVPLVDLLRDEDEGVRKAGAAALEHLAGVLDETTAAALTSLLYESKDTDESIRRVASQLLGVIPNAIGPLCTNHRVFCLFADSCPTNIPDSASVTLGSMLKLPVQTS